VLVVKKSEECHNDPDEIRDRLAHIIVEKLNSGVAMEEVRWESNLRDDLGIDSLACCRIVVRDRPGVRRTPLAQSMPDRWSPCAMQ